MGLDKQKQRMSPLGPVPAVHSHGRAGLGACCEDIQRSSRCPAEDKPVEQKWHLRKDHRSQTLRLGDL